MPLATLARALTNPRIGGFGLLCGVLLIAPWFLPNRFYFDIAILACLNAMVVVGLNLLIGYAGQISLGHAGFFGIGAYGSAILPAHAGLPPWLALIVAAVATGLLAWAIGRPILRLKGHYLAMATLGMGILISLVITNEAEWTGGPDGTTVQRLEVFGDRLTRKETWYWIAAGALVITVWLTLNLIESPTGRALRALHDSDVAAQVSGVDTAAYKLVAFVVSAVFASLAGSLFAHYSGFMTPSATGFLHSIELVTKVVLGGMGSLFGGIVGAVVLTALPQLLTAFHEYEHAIYGLILMVCMIFLPRGVVPTLLDPIAARLRGGRR